MVAGRRKDADDAISIARSYWLDLETNRPSHTHSPSVEYKYRNVNREQKHVARVSIGGLQMMLGARYKGAERTLDAGRSSFNNSALV